MKRKGVKRYVVIRPGKRRYLRWCGRSERGCHVRWVTSVYEAELFETETEALDWQSWSHDLGERSAVLQVSMAIDVGE